MGADDVRRSVRAAVVDAEDLDVLVRLGLDAVEALVEVLLDVVDGHDDGDERLGVVAHAVFLQGLRWAVLQSFHHSGSSRVDRSLNGLAVFFVRERNLIKDAFSGMSA